MLEYRNMHQIYPKCTDLPKQMWLSIHNYWRVQAKTHNYIEVRKTSIMGIASATHYRICIFHIFCHYPIWNTRLSWPNTRPKFHFPWQHQIQERINDLPQGSFTETALIIPARRKIVRATSRRSADLWNAPKNEDMLGNACRWRYVGRSGVFAALYAVNPSL